MILVSAKEEEVLPTQPALVTDTTLVVHWLGEQEPDSSQRLPIPLGLWLARSYLARARGRLFTPPQNLDN